MEKVKFKKISIKDLSFTDIMGQNFDKYNNPEANRLMVVKSEISA